MTSAEKRYFKLYTGRHIIAGNSNMQLLFNAVAAMQSYDETALLDQFQGKAFIKRFPITKRRLYETILKSLDAFHADGSLNVRMRRMLHQVEILHRKALYEDAQKKLQSVRRLAHQHDRRTIMLEVVQWERRLLECGNYSSATSDDLDRISMESEVLLAEHTEVDGLWALKSRVFMGLYRKGQARNEPALAQIKARLKDPLLKDPDALRTARAKFLFHHLHSAAAFAMGDLEKCRQHLAANRALLMAEKDRFSEDPNLILGVLSNLVHITMRLGNTNGALELLQEYRTIPTEWNMPETDDLELKLFSTTASMELAMYCQIGAFDKALDLVSSVETGLSRHTDTMSSIRKAGLYYQLAYVHFGAGQPDKAVKWTQRLLNDVNVDVNTEIACFGRMLDLLIQLELGKKDLVPYTLRNTERFIQTRDKAHRFEQYFLDMVRGALKAKDPDAMRLVHASFLDAVREIETDPLEQVVFDHLDPIAWAESKLTGRPFPDLVKERALRTTKAA